MRNFQGIIFIWTRAYREIFKFALVYLYESEVQHAMATKTNWSTNAKICKLSTSWFLLGDIAGVY